MNSVAFIPARGGSKRIKRKNVYPLAGNPLIYYSIQTLKKSKISDIYVSSDDSEILEVAAALGVKCIDRPSHLATDFATTDATLVDFADEVVADIYYIIQCTVPLLRVKTVNDVIDKFEKSTYDSVLTVCALNKFWWKDGVPLNYDPQNRPMKQDKGYDDYFENGAMYGTRRDILLKRGCRVGRNLLQFETSMEEGIDIDIIDDMKLVELIIKGGYEW